MSDLAVQTATTYFAPAERVGLDVISEQRQGVLQEVLLDTVIQSMPGYAMLLNPERQIVAVNRKLLDLLGFDDIDALLGNRPGEVFNCIQLIHAPGGCGTSPGCAVCGAVQAIQESRHSYRQAARECRITTKGPNQAALDMMAVATPVSVNEVDFTLLVLNDISGQKRREVLEKVFFHDLINIAGGIFGLASLLAANENMSMEKVKEYQDWLVTLSKTLLDDIQAQRKLLAAEQGRFVPEVASFEVRPLLEDICHLYRHHNKTPGRNLQLTDVESMVIRSDASVIRRIIGNMVINALEACNEGDTVTVSAEIRGRQVIFSVHNPGVIPDEVQMQLFNRSFSTKQAIGRGIGTYSMKLFGERYLKGRVSFISNREQGTIFSFSLPHE